jgi:mRNA interferase MazF
LNRGEIRWYTLRRPDKRRPVLILTRNEVIDHLNEIIVAPVTRTIRGLATEVVLSLDDGMPVVCALNFDHISLAQRDRIGPTLCNLPESKNGLKYGHRFLWHAVSAPKKPRNTHQRENAQPLQFFCVFGGRCSSGS